MPIGCTTLPACMRSKRLSHRLRCPHRCQALYQLNTFVRFATAPCHRSRVAPRRLAAVECLPLIWFSTSPRMRSTFLILRIRTATSECDGSTLSFASNCVRDQFDRSSHPRSNTNPAALSSVLSIFVPRLSTLRLIKSSRNSQQPSMSSSMLSASPSLILHGSVMQTATRAALATPMVPPLFPMALT